MGANVSVPMYRRLIPQRLRLEGATCTTCGEVSFPPTPRCRNGCTPSKFEPTTLSGTGVIHALTFVAPAAAPPEFAYQVEGSAGYHVAIVELDEGPLITAQLVPPAPEVAPRIGDRVVAETRLLYKDDGIRRYGFKFSLAPDGDSTK